MTNRSLYLLLAVGCWIACAVLVSLGLSGIALGDRGNARMLTAFIFLTGVGGLYFLTGAFSKQRHRFGYKYDEYATFSCPRCGTKLNYSQFPAFKEEFPCPHCGEGLRRGKGSAGVSLQMRFIPSPEVSYELAAGDGPPVESPVTAEAVRAALCGDTGFTVADDTGGWLVLTSTLGPPRWVDGPTPGEVIGARHEARLTLLPGAEIASLRPEMLALTSTEPNLTTNACIALASALGPLRVRMRGCDRWINLDPSQSSAFFAHLCMSQLSRISGKPS